MSQEDFRKWAEGVGPPPTTVLATIERPGCFNCSSLRKETESWEMPHIYWYECRARPANENLKGFPWETTRCARHTPRLPPVAPPGVSRELAEKLDRLALRGL